MVGGLVLLDGKRAREKLDEKEHLLGSWYRRGVRAWVAHLRSTHDIQLFATKTVLP